jgi:hypothetical protein
MDDFPNLTAAELLQHVGKVLYGEEWQALLAQELGLSSEAMSRIDQAADEGVDYDVAVGVLEDLRALIEERIAERRRLKPLTHGR